ncbi:DNA (cytosine-5-)-methyltransferase [Bulleidia sp. zg-1006]|uniref:DNA (cytosine-5-)-methyltransferase n=1 Tax=Bulleidia sp. zg-1006 TaxID=2806552 RepID=UPI001939C157|nr:DNA (cytosine-5-)-methyltransferase [Bulleidia sp. zg-1006]QRG86698.1 DNA (cytosine-5-)-methyltransferase [Bulleidia sp. zg-1006]
MELTVAELFAGVGGFRVGLNKIKEVDENGKAIENGFWKFVWANQFEPSTKIQHAYDCYIKRFGVEHHSNEDINKVNKTEIPDHTLLVGGFPCQDYSVARSLNSEQGIEGKKGVLFWDIRDILIEKAPPFVLLENVDRLLKSPSTKRGRDFAIMLKTFDELGYDVQWRVINAGDYSMPQKRRRVFIFAYKKNTKFANSTKLNLSLSNIFNFEFKVTLKDKTRSIDLSEYNDVFDISNNFKEGKFLDTGIMKDGKAIFSDVEAIVEEKYTLEEIIRKAKNINNSLNNYIVKDDKLEKLKYLKGSKRIERVAKNGHSYIYSEGTMAFPEKLDEPARTMLTSEGTVNRSSHIIYDTEIKEYRVLTPIECELIQMFPINWTNTMTEKRRYFMMGNALVTGIISRLESRLRKIVENE